MRLDVGSQDGTSQGKTKRIFDVTLRFYETVGAKVGPDLNNLEEIPFRSSAASMDAAVPLFTGDKKIEFRGNFETDGYLCCSGLCRQLIRLHKALFLKCRPPLF